MSRSPRPWAQDLLHFWFHDVGPARWFVADEAVDSQIVRRFGVVLKAMAKRPAHEFLRDIDTAQAAILLFDQLPRNMFRGSAQAFAHDGTARVLARGMVARGWHKALPAAASQFVLMPLMHAEAIADQRDSCALFSRYGSRRNRRFALAHWRMIARFGRFPHRNAVLGRASTPAEIRAMVAGYSW